MAAAVSGAAGFGGAHLLLPLLSNIVGPTTAIPLLTLGQIIGNLSRIYFGFSKIQWRPVGLFLITALPAALFGSTTFVELPKDLIQRLIGIAILVFVGFRLLNRKSSLRHRQLLMGGGAVVGFLSDLVGSAGPIGAAVFLELKLPPPCIHSQ